MFGYIGGKKSLKRLKSFGLIGALVLGIQGKVLIEQ